MFCALVATFTLSVRIRYICVSTFAISECPLTGNEPLPYWQTRTVSSNLRSRLALLRDHFLCDSWGLWGKPFFYDILNIFV